MKPLSETLTELGIAFSFPIEIRDANGDATYYEDSDDYWVKWERDSNGNLTYYEDSKGFCRRWERDADGFLTYNEDNRGLRHKWEYDANDKETYYEDSTGHKRGTPRSAKTCEGKVVEVDGIKYELKAL